MKKSMDRTKVTPAIVRKALTKSSLSNIAIAREVKISITNITAFRKGDDQAISTMERIKVFTLIKRGTF